MTGIALIGLLYVALIDPATKATFYGFVGILYGFFPLTVLSQLTTGPMLDMLSPIDRRGFTQGINVTVMDLTAAVTPWLLGFISDNAGISACMWTCVALSWLAAVANAPLIWSPLLQRKKKVNYHQELLDSEERTELISRAMQGDWVPAHVLAELNEKRVDEDLPLLFPPLKPYEEDKDNIKALKLHATEDMEYYKEQLIKNLHDVETEEQKEEVAKRMNKLNRPLTDQRKEAEELGRWFAEYLLDMGYFVHPVPQTIKKHMIIKSFPTLHDQEEVTKENVEESILHLISISRKFLADDHSPPDSTPRQLRKAW